MRPRQQLGHTAARQPTLPGIAGTAALDRIGRFVGHGDVARSGFLIANPSRIICKSWQEAAEDW
jgi:hypothetical protein